jgi:molybdopterin converting factor small subunit
MQVTVKLTGLARDVAKQKEVVLDHLDEGITVQGVIHLLAQRYPGLVGLVIAEDRAMLMSGNLLAVNGDLATPAFVMQAHPADGDRLFLLSIVTGG